MAVDAESSWPSPFADRTLFLLGCPRSGTSWAVRLLIAHPDIAGADAESLVFNALEDFWSNAHRTDGEGVGAYLGEEGVGLAQRMFCDGIFAACRNRFFPEANWFLEKTPDHVYRLPMLAATYPDGWFIHILRDGRDVARSLAKAPFGPDDAAGAAAMWVEAVRQVRMHSWRFERFIEIRYEDLVADPVGQTVNLFEWMGLEVDETVRAEISERASQAVSVYHPDEGVGAGKWAMLSPEDQAAVRVVAGELLAEVGYTDG
jgi:hypothetical protein